MVGSVEELFVFFAGCLDRSEKQGRINYTTLALIYANMVVVSIHRIQVGNIHSVRFGIMIMHSLHYW